MTTYTTTVSGAAFRRTDLVGAHRDGGGACDLALGAVFILVVWLLHGTLAAFFGD